LKTDDCETFDISPLQIINADKLLIAGYGNGEWQAVCQLNNVA